MSSERKKRIGKIIHGIHSLDIQGATHIAKEGIKAFLLEPTKPNAKKIIEARPTEPLLQNGIKILLKAKDKRRAALDYLEEIKKSGMAISKVGSRLIKGDMNVYAHCHSATVIGILKSAHQRRRKFVVYTTEVEPRLQGRMTAKELEKEGLKVVVGPDLSMKHLLHNCDLILVGADAFTNGHIYNKIGTGTICHWARHYDIPVYACSVSMKIAKSIKLEFRPGKEVWDERKKNIQVIYPAFDKVKLKMLTGVISEFGILRPKTFVKRAKEKMKKMVRES